MAFQLLIARGNGEGQQFVVVQPVVMIGRDDGNDVVLSDAGVSRQHTRIFEKHGRYFAEDLGSANGTLVNGEKVGAARELKTGDALAIGAALINFVQLDDGRPRVTPGVPVAGKAITGEQLIPGARAGMLPPPPSFDHEVITASGEDDRKPWETTGPKQKLFSDDAEVTAPAGKPLAFAADDQTVPVGTPLKLEPPKAEARVMLEPVHKLKSTPGLVPSAALKRSFDVSEQKTTTVVPEPERAKVLEGPTQIKAPLPPPVADAEPSLNQLLRDEAKAVVPREEDSLAPLDLSKSDLHNLQQLADATRADAKPLIVELEERAVGPRQTLVTDDSTGQGQSLAGREGSPRLTNPLPPRETAAERARRRRLLGESLGVQAFAWWGALPLKAKAIAAVVAGLVTSLVGVSLVQFFRPEAGPPLPPEPDRLLVSHERVRYFFGVGDGVHYPRPDSKEFTFELITPTDAAILVHYQAREIDRDEVAINVNGSDVGFVPADVGLPDREIETLLPQRVLKRGEKNTLSFDNVHNPPKQDPWRVGELWLELLPVPPSSVPDAMKRARDLAKQAGQLYAQRDVGSDNVFKSWKAYRLAWQVLLAVPEEQRTSLFEQVRRRSDEVAQELDRQCGQLMLDAKKQMELKNPDRAKEILDSVSQSFPTNEHRCHQQDNERLDEYQL